MDGWMDGWMDVGFSSTKNLNLRFKKENAMTDFRFVKLSMRVVLGTSVTYVVCCYQMRISNSSFAYSDWLITTKANIQSSI